ncbi:DNA glycosylase AlkZ-like family protein [Kocuria sp. M1R5S2]|uniref:DNA glycosylase AlkZ-like family protein n=1 Tax=Kocuria rhizosphaerae TaxID=3376285 RepID=UPI0037B7E680
MGISRQNVLGHRFDVQELGGTTPRDVAGVSVLDLGVQDTGTDGGPWALACRGAEPGQLRDVSSDLVLVWSLRGAPHFYRRADIAAVAAATAPFSEADAAKRVFDAAKPLRAAGIGVLEALDVVAGLMRELVDRPTVKGEVSRAVSARLDPAYLRECRSCHAVHVYEMPFRLAALRAGLELEPGTSPPVLRRIEGWSGAAEAVPDRLDVVRGTLHFLGPATPRMVAEHLDAPVREVKTRWPSDAVEVAVDGERRWLLGADADRCAAAGVDPSVVRLLGSHDLFLQVRDRELLVPDPGMRQELWVVLGRPGAVVAGGEVVGTWRPRASGGRLKLRTDIRSAVPEVLLTEQAERLAAHRGATFAGFTDD